MNADMRDSHRVSFRFLGASPTEECRRNSSQPQSLFCITGDWGQGHQQAECKKSDDCPACEYCNRAKTQPAQIIMAYRLCLLHGVMTARSYHATSLFSSSAQLSVPGVSARCPDRQTRQGKYLPISPRESLHQPVPGC